MTLDELRHELLALEGRLLESLAGSEGRLSGEIGRVRTDVSGVQSDLSGVQSDLSRVQSDVSRVQADLLRLRADNTDSFEHVTKALESIRQRLGRDQAEAL